MTREAIKFARYAQALAKEPEVREFYRMCEQALRAQLNDPLTLEELRGLEGEPVWVETIGYIGVRDGNYALVKGFDDEYVYLPSIADPDDLGSIDLYGEDWIAYRRRPEKT